MNNSIELGGVKFGLGSFHTNVIDEFESSKVTIITSKGTRRRFLDKFLMAHKIKAIDILDGCLENPTLDSCEHISKLLDFEQTSKIIAIGGGSVLDTAKVVSLVDKTYSFQDVKQIIVRGESLDSFKNIPIIAVPTTAGTGSEVTCWSTVWDPENFKKYSIASQSIYPIKAFCDPLLTLSLPLETTVSTSLDALSHAFESIWNKNANNDNRSYALKAIELILNNLEPLTKDLKNLRFRSNIMLGALYAGVAMSQTKTSVAHALSYYLTLRKNIPHGYSCGFTLPHILNIYLQQEGEVYLKYSHLERLKKLFKILNVSTSVKDYGVTFEEFNEFFAAGSNYDRMQNSLIDLSKLRSELEQTL